VLTPSQKLSSSTALPRPGATIGGTPATPGVEPDYTFTVQGTGSLGQPLYQAYSIMVDPNEPLAITQGTGWRTER
jgi:hypothetical protein